MLRELKRLVDPWLLARQSRRFAGEVPVASMTRLVDLLANPEGVVEFDLRFEASGPDLAFAELQVATELNLICQRSLATFRLPLESRSRLAFYDNEADADRCPEDREPVLVEGRQMPLLQLLEDDLILALPVVAIDPGAEMPAEAVSSDAEGLSDDPAKGPQSDEDGERNQPFSDLARMLRDD